MIRITDDIAIEDWELVETFARASGPGGQNVNKVETFARASGPGGQNVNKVETAVVLRFEAQRSPNLPDPVKTRLRRLAGRRWTEDGAVVIQAQSHRSQARNRAEALDRLVELIRRAAEKPKRRIPTRPTLASKRRRIEAKKQRGQVKALRAPPSGEP